MRAELLCVPCGVRRREEFPVDERPEEGERIRFTPGWSTVSFQCERCAQIYRAGCQAVAFTVYTTKVPLFWWFAVLEERPADSAQIHAWEARALLMAIAEGEVTLEGVVGAGVGSDGTYWGFSGDVSFGTAGNGPFARWNLTFFNDVSELDYLDSCTAPDGRTGNYQQWTDNCGGHDPVSLLPGRLQDRLQTLVEMVKPTEGR